MTLHNLDVGIALAVVMLGVSLLITILTQLIANLLSTRGVTLRKNLEVLLQSVYPEGEQHAEQIKEIAHKVLTDKLVSDSALREWQWLSKIPFLRNFRLATAVRVEELIGVLDRLAPEARPELNQLAGQVRQLAGQLLPPSQQGVQPGQQPPAPGPEQVQALVQQAGQLAQLVTQLPQLPVTISGASRHLWRVLQIKLHLKDAQPGQPAVDIIRQLVQREREATTPQIEAIGALIKKVKEDFAGNPAQNGGIQVSIDRLLQTIPGASEVMLKRDSIKSWFNSSMDRASQQFALHMRVWTIVCSVVVAFGLHLDTFRFLSQVSADPELRASLVNASQTMQNQAAAILGQSKQAGQQDTAPVRGTSSIYIEALGITAKENPDKVPATLQKGVAVQHFSSRDQADSWLRAELTGKTDAEIADVVDKFQANADKILAGASKIDQLLDHAASIRGSLDAPGFRLLEDPYAKWDYFQDWLHNPHFWGIVFSAGLLSLGAPFWFNALKSLSSLRPIVASKEEQERKAA